MVPLKRKASCTDLGQGTDLENILSVLPRPPLILLSLLEAVSEHKLRTLRGGGAEELTFPEQASANDNESGRNILSFSGVTFCSMFNPSVGLNSNCLLWKSLRTLLLGWLLDVTPLLSYRWPPCVPNKLSVGQA